MILIKCNKERLVTRSSTESELVCLSDGVALASHCAEFLKYQGLNVVPELMQDNMSTIKLAEKGKSTSDRTRHIKIRYYFVNQFLESGEMKIRYCPTDEMVADILTKPLQGEKFKILALKLLGYTRHLLFDYVHSFFGNSCFRIRSFLNCYLLSRHPPLSGGGEG